MAFRTVLMTTTEPERIWTGNWSHPQIQQFAGLLETAQVLPTTSCGLTVLASEVLHLSRILSRTALQLWIVKTSIETPILRRHRIAAAGDDTDAGPPSPRNQEVPPDVSTEASTSGSGHTPDVAPAAPPPSRMSIPHIP